MSLSPRVRARHKGTVTAGGNSELDTLLAEGVEELGRVSIVQQHLLSAPAQPVPHRPGAVHSTSDLSLFPTLVLPVTDHGLYSLPSLFTAQQKQLILSQPQSNLPQLLARFRKDFKVLLLTYEALNNVGLFISFKSTLLTPPIGF